MAKLNLLNRVLLLLACGIFILVSAMLLALPAQASDPKQNTEEYCLSCHNDPDLSMTLPNGETLSLYISPDVLANSMHSPLGIECEACHTNITSYPHPTLEVNTRRELSRSYYLACQKCHSQNYDKTLDSMHAKAAEAGNLEAPICTDCHGAHDVRPPDQPRALISETCGQCHTEIFTEYKQSIHGKALIEENNTDVPVCTDCHGVHNIQDPRTQQFRIASPEMCANCHSNADLMGKYGLNADVYNIYKLSWHGVDVSVYKAKWPTIWHDSAVCTDCHGIHNILKTSDPASQVNEANLLATCQKCHPGVSANWTGAWTGHNEISLERTPFVYYTNLFYKILIPIVLWTLVLYVGLQILRATVARIQRSLR